MSGDRWVSLIALAGWLVLSLGAYRAHQVSARRTVIVAFAWAAIFALVTAIFAAVGR